MKKIIALTLALFITLATLPLAGAKNFTDVKITNPNITAINYLSEKGIINGYTDGTFQPYKEINRAELVKILLESRKYNIEQPTTNCFSDVPYAEWYAPYICTAKKLGIVNGYADGSFKPDQTINKVEALKIIGTVFQWKTTPDENEAWYTPYVNYSQSKNFLPETSSTFIPAENSQRGYIAEILYRQLSIKETSRESFSQEVAKEVAEMMKTKLNSQNQTTTLTTSNQIETTDLKIVLSWTDEETDLDAHFIQPSEEEVFFMYKISSDLHIILETNATENTETMSIKGLEEGNYQYFVHKYSSEKTFAQSGAKVEIYNKNGLAKIFYPPSGNEEIWQIFSINQEGKITTQNQVDSCENLAIQSTVCH